MLSIRRPAPDTITTYRQDRLNAEPTCTPVETDLRGFRVESFSRVVGAGDGDFQRAIDGLRSWCAHRGSGVEVLPDSEPAEGATVALLTRQVGVWVLAACRLISVIDRPDEFGFTYATLPGHPECGYESFLIRSQRDLVLFEIEATSKPGTAVVRLGQPLARRLQRSATEGYLDALARWVRDC